MHSRCELTASLGWCLNLRSKNISALEFQLKQIFRHRNLEDGFTDISNYRSGKRKFGSKKFYESLDQLLSSDNLLIPPAFLIEENSTMATLESNLQELEKGSQSPHM